MPIMLREGKKVSRGHQLCQILKQRVGDTGVLVAKSLGPSEVSPQSGETRTRCWQAMDVAVLVIPMSSTSAMLSVRPPLAKTLARFRST
jgi:hypothetical protein